MSLSNFIDDGYTGRKKFPAVPGIHLEAVVTFRPATAKARTEMGYAADAGADRVHEFENKLIERQRVEVNGERVTAEKAGRMVPGLREKVLHLVLGRIPVDEDEGGKTDEAADAKN